MSVSKTYGPKKAPTREAGRYATMSNRSPRVPFPSIKQKNVSKSGASQLVASCGSPATVTNSTQSQQRTLPSAPKPEEATGSTISNIAVMATRPLTSTGVAQSLPVQETLPKHGVVLPSPQTWLNQHGNNYSGLPTLLLEWLHHGIALGAAMACRSTSMSSTSEFGASATPASVESCSAGPSCTPDLVDYMDSAVSVEQGTEAPPMQPVPPTQHKPASEAPRHSKYVFLKASNLDVQLELKKYVLIIIVLCPCVLAEPCARSK